MSSRGPVGFSRHHCTREANIDAASRVAKSSADKRMIATSMHAVDERVSIRRLRVVMLSPPGRVAAGRGETRYARDVALLLLDVGGSSVAGRGPWFSLEVSLVDAAHRKAPSRRGNI